MLSMFDEYPAKERRGRRRRDLAPCCAASESMPSSWRVLHHLCHSRVAFTEDRLADMADVTPRTARAMCDEALTREWLLVPFLDGAPKEGTGRMWVGVL